MHFATKFMAVSFCTALAAAVANAQTCNLVTSGVTMTLANDCVTTSTITIPDGFTLNGNGHLITAVDPDPSNSVYFSGAVVANALGASSANVKNLIIDAPNLEADFCAYVEGIAFDSVSGSILGNTILHVGRSGCVLDPAGIGIQITDTAAAKVNVTVARNKVLAAPGLEPTFGVNVQGALQQWRCTVNVIDNQLRGEVNFQSARGVIARNFVDSNFIGITIAYDARGVKVIANDINLTTGNAVVGIFILKTNRAIISGNRVFNFGLNSGTGIENDANATNKITHNQVRCYSFPFAGPVSPDNVVLPCPW
jgi:hypothetical protein